MVQFWLARVGQTGVIRPHLAWATWTLGLSLVFGRMAAANLGNYRPVSNDEVELLAVAYKLANQGVLGSDLYAGFAGADQHFLITLPLQHFFEALSFKLFGMGIAQARWVSLIAGLALVWAVSWLAYCWYGLGTAVVADLLLVLWPSNLTAAPNGLPWLGVSRAARYDVLAVAFAWLAIVLLDAARRRPLRVASFGLGLCCGLAALAQFFGAFAIPLVVLNLRGMARPTLYWAGLGAGLVLLPWLAFVESNRADLAAQLAVYSDRWDVLNPAFYVQNIMNEPTRYQGLLQVGGAQDPAAANSLGSQWLLAIGLVPAVAFIFWRGRKTPNQGDRLLWSSLVTFGILLVLLDQTKTPLYAIVLVPSICLALAKLSTSVWNTKWWLRPLLVGIAIVVGTDGIRAYQAYSTQAAQASQYLGVGRQLEEAITPGAHVLGPERWWWALHDHQYGSLRSVWWQWWAEASAGKNPQFAAWVRSNRADAVIVNDNIRDDIRAFPDGVQRQFWAFVAACTTQVLDLSDASYLRIEVDRIIRPPPALEVCGGNL